MDLFTARLLMPVSSRLDWPRGRLTYFSRRSYGDRDSWRARMEKRLRAHLERWF